MVPKILFVDQPADPVASRRSLGLCGPQRWNASNDLEQPGEAEGSQMLPFSSGTARGEITPLQGAPIIYLPTVHANGSGSLEGNPQGAPDRAFKPAHEVNAQFAQQVLPELVASHERLQQALDELAELNQQLTREIAERKRMEAVMRHQATHDPLTGLPNRALFSDRLKSAIQRANRHQDRFAMAYVDIDDFKLVNDDYGHAAGDALLQEIAARLSAQLRANDTVARLGGDEFALILEEIGSPQAALKLCEKLVSSLAEPYQLQVNDVTTTVRIGASVGIAAYRLDERADADERLMHVADIAMYEAKRGGKKRCVLAD